MSYDMVWSLTYHVTQVLIKDLKVLSDNCRSSSCIEHAAGIMEEEKIPEKLSKGVSTMSLTRHEKKVFAIHNHIMLVLLTKFEE